MNTCADRRHRIFSLGLSLLLNGVLLCILMRLAAAPRAAERYLAVQLQIPAVTRARLNTSPAHEPKVSSPSPKHTTITRRPAPPADIPGTPIKAAKPASSSMLSAAISDSAASGAGGTAAGGPGEFTGAGDGVSAPGYGGGVTGGSGGGGSTPSASSGRASSPQGGRSGTSVGGASKGESRSPQAISRPRPLYPPDARSEGIEGTVVLLASIGVSGKVNRMNVESSSGDRRLDRAAENAVKQWTYSPALKNGAPAEYSVRVRVKFRLE